MVAMAHHGTNGLSHIHGAMLRVPCCPMYADDHASDLCLSLTVTVTLTLTLILTLILALTLQALHTRH